MTHPNDSKPKLATSLEWLETLHKIQEYSTPAREAARSETQVERIAIYVLDPRKTQAAQHFVIDFWASDICEDGEPHERNGEPYPIHLSEQDLEAFPSLEDREILATLSPSGNSGFIPSTLEEKVLERLSAFKRLYLANADGNGIADKEGPLSLESRDVDPWGFKLSILEEEDGFRFKGWFHRRQGTATQTKPMEQALCVLPRGWVVFKDMIARIEPRLHWGWLKQLQDDPAFVIPKEDGQRLAEALMNDPYSPQVDLPASLEWRQSAAVPKPIGVFTPNNSEGDPESVHEEAAEKGMLLKVSFDYQGKRISPTEAGASVVIRDEKLSIKRDLALEEKFLTELRTLGLEEISTEVYRVARGKFAFTVQTLMAHEWQIFAKGSPIQKAKHCRISVKSDASGFELEGRAQYESGTVSLPAMVSTSKSGESLIQLGDGDWGMLPTEWLDHYAPLNEFNDRPSKVSKPIHFSKSQGVLLDAWLAEEEDLVADDAFLEFREKLKELKQLDLIDPPKTFKGTLRNYQKEGLGWLCNLSKLGFGGILADDMGLGKTIQLLAFFETRRKELAPKEPSIIVVPKSLVANWIEEAAKFAPKLKVLAYHGNKRHGHRPKFGKHDLIVTTYNTVRIDIELLKEVQFDCAVIDEAQAIKNSKSLVSKSIKLLKARWRLALTGTPIENDLTDLFSIVEFANPGFLRKSLQKSFMKQNQDPKVLEALSRAFQPFILRRTKEQVLTELPTKTEQTLFCELSPPEQKVYDDLKVHFRNALKRSIGNSSLAKSKMQVLEALLRLRQAACHPGLIDPSKAGGKSAKVELLVEQLEEILQGGNKVLVFSQFTSLLSIVRKRLDSKKIVYEYLDGQTNNRQERVKNFQENPKIKVFLISLKAGGVGLNLTKASYVFLLDPWWNPAVEAQAIDRSHRYGQKNRVFAYRLVAKGTVEEKILALQKDKRKLAEAIISSDGGMLKSLKAEDLNLLLS